jgi:hypothetical protein
MSYTQATIYSAKLEDYVLKIHGQGLYDVYIQLPNLNAMHTWQSCFNQKRPDYLDFRRKPSQPTLDQNTNMFESGLSHDYLLAEGQQQQQQQQQHRQN